MSVPSVGAAATSFDRMAIDPCRLCLVEASQSFLVTCFALSNRRELILIRDRPQLTQSIPIAGWILFLASGCAVRGKDRSPADETHRGIGMRPIVSEHSDAAHAKFERARGDTDRNLV
ncbi:unnamed protein product [Clonostachys solani]|uniref:Uncharacterized protein n=1 Tax=Clonostachys solani TaxID=160281 RepID=A0A9N9YZH4_9HYPO|nr:unnamed protein product [Clonostachys solani]